MFTCSACYRRALRSAVCHLPFPPWSSRLVRSSRGPLIQAPILPRDWRAHATLASIRKGHHRRRLFPALRDREHVPPNKRRATGKTPKHALKDLEARQNNRDHLDVHPEERALQKKAEFEAQYLGDPLKLAHAVVAKLRDNEVDAALALVRASERLSDGKTVENVVSWNHIIDWLMNEGGSVQAMKIYNEMKKRGHRPDAHTYTIMLRGFRQNIRKPNAVKNAVQVYNSIFAPNSTVTPNTIHTNAILDVCAKGGDLDSLWIVAGRLPEKGPGAPDRTTFTTILNAIQGDARKRIAQRISEDGPDADTNKVVESAIQDARRLWVDITARWRKGDVHLDESLVCAMGRLLLMSKKRRDLEDIFALTEQTMNLHPSRANIGPREADEAEDGGEGESQLDQSIAAVSGAKGREFVPFSGGGLVPTLSSSPDTIPATRSSIYAAPGNNTLSMLIEAATLTKRLPMGKAYWDLLTSPDGPFNISPDAQNITAYLRLLRVSRSSRAVLDLLRLPWPADVAKLLYRRGTFVIAMSTCVRDKHNPNVFDTASRILDLMQEKMEVADEGEWVDEDAPDVQSQMGQKLRVDPKVLNMYLGLAVATTKGLSRTLLLKKTHDGDLDFERDPRQNNAFRALRRLRPDMVDVKRMIKAQVTRNEYDALPKAKKLELDKLRRKGFVDTNKIAERVDDLVGLLRGMVGAYDRILAVNEKLEDEGKGPLDKTFVDDCWTQKRKLGAFLGKMADGAIPGQGERSGLWEGYDPNAKTSFDDDLDDDDRRHQVVSSEMEKGEAVVEPDTFLAKIPAQGKLDKLIKKGLAEKKRRESERRLSRRQKREVEKIERIRRQFPPSMLKPYPQPRLQPKDGLPHTRPREDVKGEGEKEKEADAPELWSAGYNRMVNELGEREKERSGFVQLGSS